jgi:hypothetical protein
LPGLWGEFGGRGWWLLSPPCAASNIRQSQPPLLFLSVLIMKSSVCCLTLDGAQPCDVPHEGPAEAALQHPEQPVAAVVAVDQPPSHLHVHDGTAADVRSSRPADWLQRHQALLPRCWPTLAAVAGSGSGSGLARTHHGASSLPLLLRRHDGRADQERPLDEALPLPIRGGRERLQAPARPFSSSLA